MIKRSIFLLGTLVSLLGAAYNPTIMAIEAKLFPKIALLEQHVKSRTSTSLKITIVSIESEREFAVQFKERMEKAYPNGILGRSLQIGIEPFSKTMDEDHHVLIVLTHSDRQLKKIAQWANEKKIVTMAYDPYHLKYGLLVSIYFGKTAQPYINRKVSNEVDFEFDHYLLNLAKFYDE